MIATMKFLMKNKNSITAIITAADAELRNRALESFCAETPFPALLAECAALERFRHTQPVGVTAHPIALHADCAPQVAVTITSPLAGYAAFGQVSVAVDVAEQMRDVFRGGAPRAAVNAPLILPETLRQLEPWMALVEKLGRLYTQLHPGALKRVEFGVAGEIAQAKYRRVMNSTRMARVLGSVAVDNQSSKRRRPAAVRRKRLRAGNFSCSCSTPAI